jgi:hypothetical protein
VKVFAAASICAADCDCEASKKKKKKTAKMQICRYTPVTLKKLLFRNYEI